MKSFDVHVNSCMLAVLEKIITKDQIGSAKSHLFFVMLLILRPIGVSEICTTIVGDLLSLQQYKNHHTASSAFLHICSIFLVTTNH